MKLRMLGLSIAISALVACGGGKEEAADGGDAKAKGGGEKVVNVINWSDYIAEDTNANFEKASGIKVVYDVFDSNEVLETKLLAGKSGYDVVVPSSDFLGRQILAGVFHPLDKSKIPNYSNLDPEVMKRLENLDPGNQYGIPYMIGTTGIGYNVDKLKAAFGSTEIANSLDLIFKPENISKMKDCGVTVLDAPVDIIKIALHYLGEDPNSQDPQVIEKAVPLLKSIRPYITTFHSSSYIDALAAGDTCLVLAWSGDIIQARDRAKEAGNGVNIAYSIPKEGAPQWFDMLAIPKDAKNLDEAYAYINYLLDPKVMAANSNYISYPNAIPATKPLIDPSITGDPTLYPPPEVAAKLWTFTIAPPKVAEQYTRIWTDLKTGR
jgi:putrescine transport system substrate-binding protein